MAQANDISGDQRQRLSNQYETLLRSLITLRGDHVSATQLGQIVEQATATASPAEWRDPAPSTDAIARLQQILVQTVETDARQRPTNLYSAEAARAEQAAGAVTQKFGDGIDASRIAAIRMRERLSEGDSGAERSASGARYDTMSASDWGSPAGLAKMRDYAIQSGLPWATNNPELLRLGPAAISALAEVHLKQQTYKRLTGDASFKAKDVVTLAQFAKEHHLDPEKLGGGIADAEKVLTPQERDRLNRALIPYMAKGSDPSRRDELIKAFGEAIKAHPEHRQKFERTMEDLKLSQEALTRENKMAGEKDVRAGEKDARAGEKDAKAANEAGRTRGKAIQAAKSGAAADDALTDFMAAPAKGQPDTPKSNGEKPKPASPAPSAQPPKAQPQKAAVPVPT